jgi:N-acetyl sugar amidotransferase
VSQKQYCSRCLYTTEHPLGLVLDDQGVCSGCRVHEEKDRLDWESRWQKLVDLVRPHRDSSGRNYDCIVPVTGANDSYYMLHIVKTQLKMNPLLVTYNKYFNTPLGIRNLANLRIRFNCDILIQNVSPSSVRNITRSTLRQFGSIYWPCLAGQTVFPVQTAVRYNVPLIVWGAHQGVEQVGMFSHEHEVQMTRRYRKDHDLMGYEADDLLSVFDTLKEEDVWQYRYPEDSEISRVGVTGIYLGNYVRWDPKSQHEQMIRDYGYQTTSFTRTFDCYDHVDCFNFMDLHDLLKLYKHGYSKVTDHACREIRHGRLAREEAIALVRQYEQQPARFSELLYKWLGITPLSMQFLMDVHRNQKFWKEIRPNEWEFNGNSADLSSSVGINCTEILGRCHFKATESTSDMDYSRYITIGKGHP